MELMEELLVKLFGLVALLCRLFFLMKVLFLSLPFSLSFSLFLFLFSLSSFLFSSFLIKTNKRKCGMDGTCYGQYCFSHSSSIKCFFSFFSFLLFSSFSSLFLPFLSLFFLFFSSFSLSAFFLSSLSSLIFSSLIKQTKKIDFL